MGGIDYSDAPRLQASEVALNPPVGGNENVQDALDDPGGTGAGPLVLAPVSAGVQADTQTSIACDGNTIALACIVASPPDWMDDAGNIIAPGLYQLFAVINIDDAPTTPGLYVYVAFGVASAAPPLDELPNGTAVPFGELLPLSGADVPYAASIQVTPPTDLTGTLLGQCGVQRIAYNAGTDAPS